MNDQTVTSRIWVQEKTAVSENPPATHGSPEAVTVVRLDEPLPQFIVPLNTDIRMARYPAPDLSSDDNSSVPTADLRNIDLVDDSPVFIGTVGASDYDTPESMWERGAYPKSIEVDPLFTVAGAGIETSF